MFIYKLKIVIPQKEIGLWRLMDPDSNPAWPLSHREAPGSPRISFLNEYRNNMLLEGSMIMHIDSLVSAQEKWQILIFMTPLPG